MERDSFKFLAYYQFVLLFFTCNLINLLKRSSKRSKGWQLGHPPKRVKIHVKPSKLCNRLIVIGDLHVSEDMAQKHYILHAIRQDYKLKE